MNNDEIAKIYDPKTLEADEKPFASFFEQVASEFTAPQYRIWVGSGDYQRRICAGVQDDDSGVVVKIYCKYQKPIQNPWNAFVIQRVREHFESGSTQDLLINCPAVAV
uniref:Uncharacterized protein n=1 Tax=Oscillatoriales cyanobacterium SpSt-402 TaxID=2282168 RepID=A0A832H4I2_9CYAN